MLMRHRCLGFANSVSAEFNKESEEICLHSSRIILRITDALHKKADHVDTTWYSVTTIFLATLTILFSLDSKKDMDPREVEQLKRDMKSSADIIQSIGRILGRSKHSVFPFSAMLTTIYRVRGLSEQEDSPAYRIFAKENYRESTAKGRTPQHAERSPDDGTAPSARGSSTCATHLHSKSQRTT